MASDTRTHGAENISPPNTDNDVFSALCKGLRAGAQCSNDVQSRQDYQRASELFQQTLSPYLLRRDKRASWLQSRRFPCAPNCRCMPIDMNLKFRWNPLT